MDKHSLAGNDPVARQGLILLYTGDGKGKTTAALGLLFRAWGQGLRTCMIQFIKSKDCPLGEKRTASRLGIEWHQMGDGFVRRSADIAKTAELARAGWALAQEKIVGNAYDLLVLDEFTYPFKYGWLAGDDVALWLKQHKPEHLHLVITGRQAPDELVTLADLVTHMDKIKHPYDRGIRAQAGIEF